jgi:hypothetical protein
MTSGFEGLLPLEHWLPSGLLNSADQNGMTLPSSSPA